MFVPEREHASFAKQFWNSLFKWLSVSHKWPRIVNKCKSHCYFSYSSFYWFTSKVWSAKKGNSTSNVFKFKYMFIFHYIFLVLSFVNVLVLNKLSKEGITSKIQSITIFTEIVTFSFVDFHLIWSTKMSSRILKIKIKETARLKDKIHVFCFLYRVFVSLFKNSFTRFFDSLPCKNPRKIHICK